jgi:DNA-binding IclR family transcriptional regulator
VSNFDYDLPTRRSAMQLLALLPPPPRAIGIMELAGDLQIDRRGILGLITTLQHRGFGIERDLDTQTAWATKAGWERIEHEAGRWIDENE